MKYVNHIRVWRFEDAPQELRELSDHGGDEDWLALIPPNLGDSHINWLESSRFSCWIVSEHSHPELPGYTVRIGAHA